MSVLKSMHEDTMSKKKITKSAKSKDLVIVNTKVGQYYIDMQKAISLCHSVDDCKEIADQSAAIGAYFKQIKDEESVRKLMEIRLRAWRRIGEICKTVDSKGCDTQTAYYRKIKIMMRLDILTESQIYTAVKIAELPTDYFEHACTVGGPGPSAIVSAYNGMVHMKEEAAWRASPEGKAALRRQEECERERQNKRALELAERAKEAAQRTQQATANAVDLQALIRAREIALKEVGYTLDRRDRENMHHIVFLIKNELHRVLRQAAFDNKMTMQAILREGLMLWFLEHGYADVNGLHTKQRSSPKQTSPPANAS